MASGGPGPPGAGGAPTGAPGLEGGAFGPTARPGEPATFGASTGAENASSNVDHLIRMMYAQFPHPAIAQLMRKEPERR